MSVDGEEVIDNSLTISLSKPMGLVLEEIEEGKSCGVKIKEIAEGGSAALNSDIKVGMKLKKIESLDCTTFNFDDIMDQLIAAESPVNLILELESTSSKEKSLPLTESLPIAEAADENPGPFELSVIGPKGQKNVLVVKKGSNLRKELQNNKIDVYEMMAKMTNCNGGGQCGTCMVDVLEGNGCGDKSEWETNKLKGKPESFRLACQTVISGPAVIRTRPLTK
eukprot:CAMPEP_0117758662 /NCGR_PEP_ID=MMETSP0947-20121206/15528_1 /TAXON_ID=44440 /ORGANISM="Chattonella subsalsa, Strain CCMP2191" /LENGTH=222 /DNA_ID=CAMNT_0005578925 /DNA_START=210 /DNA_END=878 /DNA_ORIENTATION=-